MGRIVHGKGGPQHATTPPWHNVEVRLPLREAGLLTGHVTGWRHAQLQLIEWLCVRMRSEGRTTNFYHMLLAACLCFDGMGQEHCGHALSVRVTIYAPATVERLASALTARSDVAGRGQRDDMLPLAVAIEKRLVTTGVSVAFAVLDARVFMITGLCGGGTVASSFRCQPPAD